MPPGKLAVGIPARIREIRQPAEPDAGASHRPRHDEPDPRSRRRRPARRRVLIIVVLTLLEGFFVAAEIALVSVRRSRIEQLVDEGRPGARRVRRLLDEPGRFLAVSSSGSPSSASSPRRSPRSSLSDQLARLLAGAGLQPGDADTLALIIVTVILALFTILFAELVPKTLALANAERVALTLSRPGRRPGPRAHARHRCSSPAPPRPSRGLFGASVTTEQQISAEELRLIVERGGEQGILEAEEEQMINAVIELGDRRLHEVMTPRIAIVALPATATFDEAIDPFVEQGHSRIPVYETSVDDIVGILYAKDLLPFLKPGVRAAGAPVAAPDAACSCPSR